MHKAIPVQIEIDITGYYFNKWPDLQISCNGIILYDAQIINNQILKFEIICGYQNSLTIKHYNKSFGDQGLWHTDGNNECWAQINQIKFDGVSLGGHVISELEFITDWTPNQVTMHDKEFIEKYSKLLTNGKLTFNGEINLDFETPVYNWLIVKKFKLPIKQASYFSNATRLWHYEEELQIVEDIKKIMNL